MLVSPWWFLSFVLAAAAALVCAYGWRLARKGWALAREERDVVLRQLERVGAKATANVVEIQRLTRELELERGGVRHLVPSFSAAKSSDVSAGFLRQAFRAWILWFNDCPGVLPMRDLLGADVAPEVRHLMCCELYARAVMESAAAAHLDGANPRSDREVLRQLAEALGDELAARVAGEVAARGVVFSSAQLPAAEAVAAEPAPASRKA